MNPNSPFDFAKNQLRAGINHVKSNPRGFIQGIVQNRVTLVSLILFLGPQLTENKIDNTLTPIMGFPLGITGLGVGTYKIYQRTLTHIKKFGKIGDKFFKKTLGRDIHKEYMGYCQLQGMYLAAKELGKIEEFYELKKKYSKNKIPNF